MNLIDEAKLSIEKLLNNAYESAVEKGTLPAGCALGGTVEIPKDTSYGDYASSSALAAARSMRMAPRKIAEALVAELDLTGSFFEKVEIAGAGFINFRLGSRWYGDVLRTIEAEGRSYGESSAGGGEKVMVEFVSANPTGPMHMGNARGGVLGDTLANVLRAAGYDVWKEFYVNDAGNQVHKFAVSIYARAMQEKMGEDNYEFPEDGYHGEDIRELARGFLAENPDFPQGRSEESWQEEMAKYGLERNIPKMKADLRKYGIEYDQWFFESSLHESGFVADTVEKLAKNGWTYEKEGALWLRTADLLRKKYISEGKTPEEAEKLDLKDDVLRRANGFYTYFAADIAYHRNKLEERGFSKVINVWGADHHGHVARLQAAVDGLGLEGSKRIIIVLMQLVNLLQDGQPVRMSKRTGKAIALNDLLDEISVDAARYYFNNRAATSPLDFDLDLAVRQDSENPVYYVQYAHARICTLINMLASEGHAVRDMKDIKPELLTDETEIALIKELSALPEEVKLAARDLDPSRINRYVTELAARFHRFYNACRVKGAEPELLDARLKLAATVRAVIENCLTLLGVTAPEKM